MTHYELARRWAKWNGMKGTEKQVTRIMKSLSISSLTSMLKVRGIL